VVTGLIAIILVGFVLGMRHACDADHVIAISTIVARRRSLFGAAVVGVVWGAGHTLTILVVGAAIIVFSVVIPPRLGLSMELAVGVMLVALGAMNLTGVTHRIFHRIAAPGDGSDSHRAEVIHSHAHWHGALRHSHPHFHLLGAHEHQRDGAMLGAFDVLRPLAVGIVHGLAGSAAIALLVLTTIHDPIWSLIYLLMFGTGTVAGMVLITVGMAAPLAVFKFRSAKVERALVLGSGLVSLGFGFLILYQIGFADGLFGGVVTWTPH
jgi:hypothetical protein